MNLLPRDCFPTGNGFWPVIFHSTPDQSHSLREENVVSEVAAAFEERGATVREISVEEALARDQITVSEENAD